MKTVTKCAKCDGTSEWHRPECAEFAYDAHRKGWLVDASGDGYVKLEGDRLVSKGGGGTLYVRSFARVS